MTHMTLYIGNKNLSSWSLRPWLLMRNAGIDFEERLIRLDRDDTRDEIVKHSPSGQVPALVHDGQVIWDSLAICEYLNELYPEKHFWPQDTKVRAVARCISSEMHSSFSALRQHWPMNFTRSAMSHLASPSVKRDIKRITDIWAMCRQHFSDNGPYLFGPFTIADAMYAPVVSRFRTYGPLDLSTEIVDYCHTVWSMPAMREWGQGANDELVTEEL